MIVLAVDPGTTESALVEWDGARVVSSSISANEDVRADIIDRITLHKGEAWAYRPLLAIEEIRCMGMAVGESTLKTCWWTGRFAEAWLSRGGRCEMIGRMDVKMHLCHHPRARDPNVRQALLDRLGPVGTKKNPGPLFGIATHKWAALAVAVTVWDREHHAASTQADAEAAPRAGSGGAAADGGDARPDPVDRRAHGRRPRGR